MQRLVSFQKILEPPLQKMGLFISNFERRIRRHIEYFIAGFSTFTLPISQLLKNEKMVIVLEEKTTSLNEVVVNSTSFYVRQALKN